MASAEPAQRSSPFAELEVRGYLADPGRCQPRLGIERRVFRRTALLEELDGLAAHAPLLLRVDSPGGDAAAMWILYQALQDYVGLVVAYRPRFRSASQAASKGIEWLERERAAPSPGPPAVFPRLPSLAWTAMGRP